MTEPVELTAAEVNLIGALSKAAGADVWTTEVTDAVRALVRQEIASLAGLAMRRLQDESFTRSFEHNAAVDAAKGVLGHFWGEVLAEYGGRD